MGHHSFLSLNNSTYRNDLFQRSEACSQRSQDRCLLLCPTETIENISMALFWLRFFQLLVQLFCARKQTKRTTELVSIQKTSDNDQDHNNSKSDVRFFARPETGRRSRVRRVVHRGSRRRAFFIASERWLYTIAERNQGI